MARRRAQVELRSIVASFGRGAGFDDDADVRTILDAAAQLLVAHGLRRWSIDDVAARAGLGRTTVYRKIGGRDDIVHAVLARELRTTFAAIAAAAAPHESLEDRLVAGTLAARHALEHSIVDGVLRADPATFLPFLTTGAGPLLEISRMVLVPEIMRAGLVDDADRASELAELLARVGLSFVLTRDTAFPADDAAFALSVRRLFAPLLSRA